MISKYVTYKIKASEIDTVVHAVQMFVQAIKENESNTKYTAYQAADKVSFMHTMVFSDEAAESNHRQAEHTLKFVEVVYPRCEIQPVFYDLTLLANTD